MAKSKELASLRQLLILRHLQTAGARLRNPMRGLTKNVYLKLIEIVPLWVAASYE